MPDTAETEDAAGGLGQRDRLNEKEKEVAERFLSDKQKRVFRTLAPEQQVEFLRSAGLIKQLPIFEIQSADSASQLRVVD